MYWSTLKTEYENELYTQVISSPWDTMAVEKHHQPHFAVHIFLGFIWFVVKSLQIYPLTLTE